MAKEIISHLKNTFLCGFRKKRVTVTTRRNCVTFKFNSNEKSLETDECKKEICSLAHSLHVKAKVKNNLIIFECPDKYMAQTIKFHWAH